MLVWLAGLVDLVESSNILEDTFSQALQEYRDGNDAVDRNGNGYAASKSMQ